MGAPYAKEIKLLPKEDVIAALDEVRFPYEVAVFGSKNEFNFGSIIRTGNAFLCKKYYAIDIPWFYKKAAMTALQYEKHLIEKVSTEEFLAKTTHRNIVAFEKRDGLNSVSINKFSYPENPILLFGAENSGLPQELLDCASHHVMIPMYGTIWDLNIALAAGIAMQDFVAKHTGAK